MTEATTYYIYVLQNTINNKIYIGQTTNMERREGEHRAKDRVVTKRSPLYQAIQKYGFDKFKMFAIEEHTTPEEVDEAEKFYISLYNTRNREIGYNLTEGGRVNRGFTHSEKWKKEKSLSMKKYFQEHGSAITGTKHSPKRIQEMKLLNCGEEGSQAKLTNKEARQIKDLAKSKIFSIKEISYLYNVTTQIVYSIKWGKTYKNT